MRKRFFKSQLCLSFLLITCYLLYECSKREQRLLTKKIKRTRVRCLEMGLCADVILALLHAVAAPRHRRQILTSAPPQQSSPSAAPHRSVLERPSFPSTDQPAYRPMEPSNPNASPWGRRDRPSVIHGWGCPNRVAPA
jgi:hypothetical protein